MKNDFCKIDSILFRILDTTDTKTLVINCVKKSAPKWIDTSFISYYCDNELPLIQDINDIEPISRKIAYERFTLISGILPFVTEKGRRCSAVAYISEEKGISKQTINNYLWLYLTYQSISALAPKDENNKKDLSLDEKNIRWALNKYFYTPRKNSLNTAYTFMLKEKYCNESGKLLEHYPTFHQFRYFYRKHKKLQSYYISRDGIKSYQRNKRPLLGDNIQEFAHSVGFGMLDSTVCDIYLVNDSGNIIGRPILTALVDGFSGLCCGYSLSWEGGVYSLRNLLINTISDKVKHCKKFGISIKRTEWDCNKLPAIFITDKGKEYASTTFEQIADLGVKIINLEPYRPELKGAVEKFFDIIQNLYKPLLFGKGVIHSDFQERGVHDYRKDSCLTMKQFEKIIVKCILHYNTRQILDHFPYCEKMLTAKVKPYPNCVWNYGVKQMSANLITTDYETLIFTLLPRTQGKFNRKGLIVNKLRYKNDNYTEQYLTGGTCVVAYNPDNSTCVWLVENGKYIEFSLIERRFEDKSTEDIESIREQQRALIIAEKQAVLQAKIDFINDISVILDTTVIKGDKNIKGIRENRKKEQLKTHTDFLERDEDNE